MPDDTWHCDVVRRTVLQAGYDFNKLNLNQVNLTKEFKIGDFFLDGVLNDSFVKVERGKKRKYLTDETDSTLPYNNESNWRHSIAVSNGRILEKEFDMSSRWLWLDNENKADTSKGYMYKVLKVYHICKKVKVE